MAEGVTSEQRQLCNGDTEQQKRGGTGDVGVDRCSVLLMDVSEKLFGCSGEWNLSFAGCGFRSVYYVGALSCFLDHVPQLVHGASRVCGASSGCLVAAALAVGIPIGTHTHTHTPCQQTTPT